MKRFFTAVFVFLFAAAFAQVGHVPGELIIMLKDNDQLQNLINDHRVINLQATDLTVKKKIAERLNIWLLEYNEEVVNEEMMLKLMLRDERVLLAQYNHTGVQLRADSLVPNDPRFVDQWNHYNDGVNFPTGITGGDFDADMDSPEAWAIESGGPTITNDTIVIAIIDGGGDINHEDLQVWKNHHEIPNNGVDDDNNGYIDDYWGWNPDNNQGNTIKLNNHGTQVAGVAAAIGNNGKGVAGMNWDAQVMYIKGANDFGDTDQDTEDRALAAYGYVYTQRYIYNESFGEYGAFIAASNSSFGIDYGQPSNHPIWCAMYDSLGSVGVLSATATANPVLDVDAVGDMPTTCPSDFMIGVGKTGTTDASGAAYGTKSVDLGAPGGWAITTYAAGYSQTGYGGGGGTSIACPMVAGAISLMYSAACRELMSLAGDNPAAVATLFKELIIMHGVDVKSQLADKYVTSGRLNLHKCIEAVQEYCRVFSTDDLERLNQSMILYPNPAKDLLMLQITANVQEEAQLRIVDVLGKVQEMDYVHVGEGIYQLNVQDLPKGYYFVEYTSDKKVVSPFIKN